MDVQNEMQETGPVAENLRMSSNEVESVRAEIEEESVDSEIAQKCYQTSWQLGVALIIFVFLVTSVVVKILTKKDNTGSE